MKRKVSVDFGFMAEVFEALVHYPPLATVSREFDLKTGSQDARKSHKNLSHRL